MRGISEEFLKSILADNNEYKMSAPYINAQKKVLQTLINQCKELNPWLPIDENTPKDRSLLLYYPGRENDDDFDIPKIQSIGYWSFSLAIWVCDLKYCWGEEKSRLAQPTHYQELPDDPKE